MKMPKQIHAGLIVLVTSLLLSSCGHVYMPYPLSFAPVTKGQVEGVLHMGTSGFSPRIAYSPISNMLIEGAGSFTVYPTLDAERHYGASQGHLFGGFYAGFYTDFDSYRSPNYPTWYAAMKFGVGAATSRVFAYHAPLSIWEQKLGRPITSQDTLPEAGPVREVNADYLRYAVEATLTYTHENFRIGFSESLALLKFSRHDEQWHDAQADTLYPFGRLSQTGNSLILQHTVSLGSNDRSNPPLHAEVQLSFANKLAVDRGFALEFLSLNLHAALYFSLLRP